MAEDILLKEEKESTEEYLYRLGSMKARKEVSVTWKEITCLMNSNLDVSNQKNSEAWRKNYAKLKKIMSIKDVPLYADSELSEDIKNTSRNLSIQRRQILDERNSYSRLLTSDSRSLKIRDLIIEAIKREEPIIQRERTNLVTDKAVYALLSDVHYGISFNSCNGTYNKDIAKLRIMDYADKISKLGKDIGAKSCYLSLIGDMISGNIHTTTRLENTENVVQQIVGVSELISYFIKNLAETFEHVYVNSVSGNHSRADTNFENVLRNERFDSFIPWYCKAKLENVSQVEFVDNIYDDTISNFDIFGKKYIAVHGDMDKKNMAGLFNIENVIGSKIDYMISGHTHVPEANFGSVGMITNGCVCGSGDDFTVKRRLSGKPYQVCLIVSKNGVEAMYPMMLTEGGINGYN